MSVIKNEMMKVGITISRETPTYGLGTRSINQIIAEQPAHDASTWLQL